MASMRFYEGVKARASGLPLRRNPHARGSIAWRAYRDGWRAENDKRKRTPPASRRTPPPPHEGWRDIETPADAARLDAAHAAMFPPTATPKPVTISKRARGPVAAKPDQLGALIPPARRVLDWVTLRDAFRENALHSFDEAARVYFKGSPLMGANDPGASDADLPALFAAIDHHTRTLAARYGFELDEGE